MLEERNLKLDLLALGVLALTIFLAASLLGYHPADAASRLVYPEPAEVMNLCGRSGALASAVLLGTLGLGAYYLVVSLAVLAAVLLARRPLGDPLLRLLGWLLSLVGISTFSAMALPGLSPGPVIGPGGYLGAAGRGLLEMNFAAVGAYIVVASLIVGGLLLSTEYLLVRWFAWIFGVPLRVLGQGVPKTGNRADKAAAPSHRRGDAARSAPTPAPRRMASRKTSPSASQAARRKRIPTTSTTPTHPSRRTTSRTISQAFPSRPPRRPNRPIPRCASATAKATARN